jgi:hypothetical protein
LLQGQFAELEQHGGVWAVELQAAFEGAASECGLAAGFVDFGERSQPAAAGSVVGFGGATFQPLQHI